MGNVYFFRANETVMEHQAMSKPKKGSKEKKEVGKCDCVFVCVCVCVCV